MGGGGGGVGREEKRRRTALAQVALIALLILTQGVCSVPYNRLCSTVRTLPKVELHHNITENTNG